MASLSLEYPKGVCFSCTECGDCCRSSDLLLGPGEHERLSALDWSGKVDDLVGAAPVAPDAVAGLEGRHRLARRPDGACLYLGDANQCVIHEHFGESAKPLMCRLYPFSFYPMGDRVAVDVSFACRSVSEGDGASIADRVPEWTHLLDDRAAGVDREHSLRAGVPIDGALMWDLEHHVLDFLRDATLTPVERLRCVLQFARLATSGDPSLPTAATLRDAMATGIPMQIRRTPLAATMDATQRAMFYQWLHLALNPEAPGVAAGDGAATVRRGQAGRRFRDQIGKPGVGGAELGVAFSDIARVETGIFESGECRPFRDFLCAKIIGQKFLTAGEAGLPFVEAIVKLLLTFPMTVWTSKALAADRGSSGVEEPDLRQAIRLIDRTLGQIPTSRLPRKLQEAYDWVMLETDLVEAATNDVLSGS